MNRIFESDVKKSWKYVALCKRKDERDKKEDKARKLAVKEKQW